MDMALQMAVHCYCQEVHDYRMFYFLVEKLEQETETFF